MRSKKVDSREKLTLTEKLSNFIIQTRFEDFPEEVIETGKTCFLDWIGVALGGMKDPSIKILVDHVQETGGKKQASILGYGRKVDILNAALINGTMSHVLDYDDAHSESRSHCSAPLLPALLSISEYKKLKGADFMTAYIVGFEVSTRMGLALGRRYYEEGWHATPIVGRFGSAAGVGKLLKLNPGQLACAIGLAATQAGGLRSVFGTMGKPFHVGKAAMDGMLSALLALRGFQVPEEMLEGNSNFLEIFNGRDEVHRATQGLGREYQILKNSLKPYAACLLIHPAIDGLICLKEKYHIESDSVQQVDLEVSPLCLTVTNRANPSNGLEGKFSLPFCAALALVEGQVHERQFTQKKIYDHRIRGVVEKIKVSSRDVTGETEAEVTLQLKNGAHYHQKIFTPKGDPRNPMSFDEVVEKVRDLSRDVLPGDRLDTLIRLVRGLEGVKDISELLKSCCVKKIDPN